MCWIGVADRSAGITDDLVLGFKHRICGYQFKKSAQPKQFCVQTLLIGSSDLLKELIVSWQKLKSTSLNEAIHIYFITNGFPSKKDKKKITGGHSADFLDEFAQNRNRSLKEWLTTRWQTFIEELFIKSSLSEQDFEEFLSCFYLLYGSEADFMRYHKLSFEREQEPLIEHIARLIPKLVTDPRDNDRWTRKEVLEELGWTDKTHTRYEHVFPIGEYIQSNTETEDTLHQAILKTRNGYVALVGPPGSGKSTLLQTVIQTESNVKVVRYLAYVPDGGLAISRGDADVFLNDIIAQLRKSGLQGLRFYNDTLSRQKEEFEHLLKEAGNCYKNDNIRTIIVVDGLDHVPREQKPRYSFLSELPSPEFIPNGVLFVLGTQQTDLFDLKPAVRDQINQIDRKISVAPLKPSAVYEIANSAGFDASISEKLFPLSQGHPLVIQYLIKALRQAEEYQRAEILAGFMDFRGDIEDIYRSAWRGIENDDDACDILRCLAHAEGAMSLELLIPVYTERVIERVLKSTNHLLSKNSKGYSIFHNSFRQFILNKPYIRLGKDDGKYSNRIYEQLAELVRNAPTDCPQRWMELRYLVGAQNHSKVLELAQPGYFRTHLAQGRSFSYIQKDIKLALKFAGEVGDVTNSIQLLITLDEITRRSETLENATNLVTALLAIGDMPHIDRAETLAEEYRNGEYEVINALLAAGEETRARRLFEKVEPLQKLFIKCPNTQMIDESQAEFEEWAEQVFRFWKIEKINQELDKLSHTDLSHLNWDGINVSIKLAAYLRTKVALAMVRADVNEDPIEVSRNLHVPVKDIPTLLIHAGLNAYSQKMHGQAMKLFREAANHEYFSEVTDDSRRKVVLIMVSMGEPKVGIDSFDSLIVPAISFLDAKMSEKNAVDLTLAIIEYAHLATLIKKPVPEVEVSKTIILRPLQLYACTIGTLLGKMQTSKDTVICGEITRLTSEVLKYLARVKLSEDHEYLAIRQIVEAMPVLGRTLIQIAAQYSIDEFTSVLAEFERGLREIDETYGMRSNLQREVAITIYDVNKNTTAASRWLEPLVILLCEKLPSQQVNGLATLAIAFAKVKNNSRAKELLAQIHNETLGYASPPKKDHQYVTWKELLKHANKVDPANRRTRVISLVRQVIGMIETEGRRAADRIVHTLIIEATIDNAGMGFELACMLSGKGVISWSNLIDALLLGVIMRQPELAMACGIAWCALVLPYYVGLYFLVNRLGDFIETAVAAVAEDELEILVQTFRVAIEAESQASERVILLEKLCLSARKRKYSCTVLDNALKRWTAEILPTSSLETKGKYDQITNLVELKAAFEQENDAEELNYEASSAFCRLAPVADFKIVQEVFNQWQVLQKNSRARFILVDMALDAKDILYARQLVNDYDISLDKWATWTEGTGGGALRYFRALLKLDGPSAYARAYKHFINAIVEGREVINIVMSGIGDILPIIGQEPDWPVVWDQLSERLATTREYAISQPFEIKEAKADDEEVLAMLFCWALAMPLLELQRHALVGALELNTSLKGNTIFQKLISMLLTKEDDELIKGLQLLLQDRQETLAKVFGGTITALIDHPDYVVAETATILLRRWGYNVSMTHNELPQFYNLVLNNQGDNFEIPALSDSNSGVMLVEDPMGWTSISMFHSVIEFLTKQHITATHIRLGSQMYIDAWGGLAAFGRSATDRLEASLNFLKMRIPFLKPHVAVAERALRYVAGELRRAGIVASHEATSVLDLLNYEVPALPLTIPAIRPQFIQRPILGRNTSTTNKLGEEWLDQVNNDVTPILIENETIIAEISIFELRKARQASYTLKRIRAPFMEIGKKLNFIDWINLFPKSVWHNNTFIATPNTIAPTIVRTFVWNRYFSEIPRFIICPNFLNQLGWRMDPHNWLLYLDASEQIVARVVWWRDGSPIDVEEDVVWGEGVYVSITAVGVAQLKTVLDNLTIRVHANREFKPNGSVPLTKIASGNFREGFN